MRIRIPWLVALTVATGLVAPRPADAQIWKKIKKTAAAAAEQETLKQIDDLVREGIACVFDDLDCIEDAEQSGEQVVLVDPLGKPIVDDDGQLVTDPEEAAGIVEDDAPSAPSKPGEGVWANYDFVPGSDVLYADDFEEDDVGDFPRRLEWIRGNMEIVEWEGKRLLRTTAENSQFAVLFPDSVPEQFTLEFDLHDPATEKGTTVVLGEAPKNGRVFGQYFNVGSWRGSGVWEGGDPLATMEDERMTEEVVSVRIMADGAHVKAYINETRISNAPRVEMARGDRITFVVWGTAKNPIYIGNIRIAAGGKDLYDKLAENGRVATHGILFDVNSDRIRPESTPTLEEIGEMLEENPELRIAIEGHTDNTGDEEGNQKLSERRAKSVKRFLEETYGVDEGRLEAKGFGESNPMADNGTPEGRQNNRRVELVKID